MPHYQLLDTGKLLYQENNRQFSICIVKGEVCLILEAFHADYRHFLDLLMVDFMISHFY